MSLLFNLLELLVVITYLLLQRLDLSRILLDDLLAEVRSLGKLLLNFFVIGKVLRQILDNACHRFVLVHQMLSLHRLVLKFTSQLRILANCQPRGPDQLVFVHVEHLDFDVSDLKKHLFPQIVNLMDFVLLNVCEDLRMSSLLFFDHVFPVISFLLNFVQFQSEFVQFFDLHSLLVDSFGQFFNFRFICFIDLFHGICMELLFILFFFLLVLLGLFHLLLFDFAFSSFRSLNLPGAHCYRVRFYNVDICIVDSYTEAIIVLFKALVDLLDHRDKVLELDILLIYVLLLFLKTIQDETKLVTEI